MRIRIKTQWSKQEREVSLEDSVGVLAFNAWKIGMQALLEIENENFQIDTQVQRMDVIEEVVIGMIHMLDRMVYETLDDNDRTALITLYAKKMSDHVQENARDFKGKGDHRTPFIKKLNERMNDFSETTWKQDENLPGFTMGRVFGNNIAEALGPKDRQWALDYIQQILLPDLLTTYKRTIASIGLISKEEPTT